MLVRLTTEATDHPLSTWAFRVLSIEQLADEIDRETQAARERARKTAAWGRARRRTSLLFSPPFEQHNT